MKLRKSKRGKSKPKMSIPKLLESVEMCYQITCPEMKQATLESIAQGYENWTRELVRKSTKENLLSKAIKETVAEVDKMMIKGEKEKAHFLVSLTILGNDKGMTADSYINNWKEN